jgi:hypothetical protein
MKKLSIAVAVASMVFATASRGADIYYEPPAATDKSNGILITGEIIKGDYDKFMSTINRIPNDKPVMILLEGPGGSLIDAINIGLEINKRRYSTVAYKGICASACAYIWLAGDRAIIDTDSHAKVGFHSPYYIDKFGNKKSDNTASAWLGGYLKDIGASYSIISYVTSVDGDGIRWLTEPKAKELGLYAEFYKKQTNSQAQPDKSKSPIQVAQAEIVKTQEYNRVFNLQIGQLAASGQLGGPEYVRIQNAISQNNQWIKQQWDIINRLQSK